MKRREIKVIVNMPTTEEGKALLAKAVIEMNSYVLGRALDKADAPYEAKVAYIKSLNGRVPWAAK